MLCASIHLSFKHLFKVYIPKSSGLRRLTRLSKTMSELVVNVLERKEGLMVLLLNTEPLHVSLGR